MSDSLPIVCPGCALVFPVEAGLVDAAARAAMASAVRLWPGEIRELVPRYFGFFAPQKHRPSWPRLAKVMSEFVALVSSGQVSRNRETRAAPLPAWAEGLAEIQAMHASGTLDLPLRNHALLCEIVHRRARRAASAQAAATKPLHPSHRPAPSREDWDTHKGTGTKHIGALMGALGKPTNPEDPPHDD